MLDNLRNYNKIKLIPNHQFGFRQHVTVEQVH